MAKLPSTSPPSTLRKSFLLSSPLAELTAFCTADSLIFGPVIHQISSASSLNTSVAAFYAYLTGNKKDEDAVAAAGSYVDVRDVARIHIDALATPEACNERFLVSTCAFEPPLPSFEP
jgi:hypothetical protein